MVYTNTSTNMLILITKGGRGDGRRRGNQTAREKEGKKHMVCVGGFGGFCLEKLQHPLCDDYLIERMGWGV